MSNGENEIEVKFYLDNPGQLENRLIHLGATLCQPRVHEINLRFDTPDGDLTKTHRVLRLRRDASAHLTFKSPALADEAVAIRREIEFEVSSFEEARNFLEALGFTVSMTYEKYRRTYLFEDSQVMLDEMPFGNFAEIEGPDAVTIERQAEVLGLNWSARCLDSYLGLFNRLLSSRGMESRNLSFEELAGWQIEAQELGLRPADRRAGL